MIALFLGAVYSLSFLTLDNPWPMAVCLGLFFLAFWIPQTITGPLRFSRRAVRPAFNSNAGSRNAHPEGFIGHYADPALVV